MTPPRELSVALYRALSFAVGHRRCHFVSKETLHSRIVSRRHISHGINDASALLSDRVA